MERKVTKNKRNLNINETGGIEKKHEEERKGEIESVCVCESEKESEKERARKMCVEKGSNRGIMYGCYCYIYLALL